MVVESQKVYAELSSVAESANTSLSTAMYGSFCGSAAAVRANDSCPRLPRPLEQHDP